MPLDEDNLTNENVATLLRGYRVSPSDPLQQQLIEIHMGLIRETISSLPISLINQINIGDRRSSDRPNINERRVSNHRVGERRSSDRELLEVGKQGLLPRCCSEEEGTPGLQAEDGGALQTGQELLVLLEVALLNGFDSRKARRSRRQQ